MREKVKNLEVNRMRNRCILDSLTSVDIQEGGKIVGKVIQRYEWVLYRENFKKSPIKKDIEKLFSVRQKYKDEGNDFLQAFLKFLMNVFYAIQTRKDKIDFDKCK